jgi:hypothetical protein
VGGVEGKARLRIIPPLPWKFDFENDKDVPLTWIGGRIRYVLRDVDGQRVMVKQTRLPTRPGAPMTKLGTRSQMFMGPVDLANYTMQADVQLRIGVGSESAEEELEGPEPEFPTAQTNAAVKLADMALINSRYLLAISGANQELRLYSWASSDYRTQAKKPYELEPGIWYTLKLRVEPKNDSALVQGKVWKRGEAEPDAWSIELTDMAPNLQGSPGLFGNAQQAEFLVDNLAVLPN